MLYVGANLTNAGWNHYSYEVTAGEHTFTWTYSKDSSVNPAGDYFAVDNVVMSAGEIVWSDPVAVTGTEYRFLGLTPESSYYVRVQGVCDGNVTEWSEIVSFTTTELTIVTRTVALEAGTNWFSTNVEITLADLKAALVAALPGTTITIKSKSAYVTYNGTTWRGNLNTFDVSQMYQITVTAACEFELEGAIANPIDHPFTVKPGANWIGLPTHANMSLSDAFAGFAVSGDVVKSKNGYSTYNGTMWRGSLSTLELGKGYIYQSNTTTNRTLVFPSSAK